MRKILKVLVLGVPLLFLCSILIYQLPPVNDRLAWRVENLRAQVGNLIHPPQKIVFVPQGAPPGQVETLVAATLQAMTPSPTPTLPRTSTPAQPGSTERVPQQTPLPTPTSTPTLPPLPANVLLKGIIHEYQKWNNCGPSTLAMALSFWKWKGDQRDTAAFMKPNARDKNVMPYEMQNFIAQQTDFKSLVRYGGDILMLKHFLAAGFPVVVEKGFDVQGEGWMGHYEVLNGYDDSKAVFTAQDSYIGPDLPVRYDELQTFWQHFDYIYLIIYPAGREADVNAILGPQADETSNLQYSAQKASNEIASAGSDPEKLYFAWYDRGTSLMKLQDYAGAAAAYDQAFAIYPDVPEKWRPYRMLWYQTGPYYAYFYTGRYLDVVNLATTAISTTTEPAIEESFYWRALAYLQMGQTQSAIDDLQTSLQWHPNFQPSVDQLKALGINP